MLITDDVFHFLNDQTLCYTGSGQSNGGSTKQVSGQTGVITDLQNSGCKVYISLYGNGTSQLVTDYLSYFYPSLNPANYNLEAVYYGLDVNGNFDTVNTNATNLSTMYTFDKLRAQIMANWPAN